MSCRQTIQKKQKPLLFRRLQSSATQPQTPTPFAVQ